ncbi:MAG: carboxypeptidase M32 [Devosia sp.]
MSTLPHYDRFAARFGAVNDVLNAVNILNWDARTMMPPRASATRAEQIGTLTELARDLIVSSESRALAAAAAEETAHLPETAPERRAVTQALEAIDFHTRVPGDLVKARAAQHSVANDAWISARKANDFTVFAPHLAEMLRLSRLYADAIGWQEHPYDALVGLYEPGETARSLSTLFGALREGLKPIYAAATARPAPRSDFLFRAVPPELQRKFAARISEAFTFDTGRGRLDISVHPFEVSFTRNDVRLTTRYRETFMPMALFGTLHETGHGLYEQNIDPAYTRSVLATDLIGLYAVGGTSFGAHESQSRLWENHVGRSRAFWQRHIEDLKADIPGVYDDVTAEDFYRGITRVSPGLTRVESDEMSYDFHIMLRVELEQALLDGSLSVADLPGAWNAAMKRDLGLDVPDDLSGCLQDIHWSVGYLGSFPTYTIGNITAAQLMETARSTAPQIIAATEAGDYAPLADWLREAVWQHGRRFSRDELLTQVTGRPLEIAPYLAYLTARYTQGE